MTKKKVVINYSEKAKARIARNSKRDLAPSRDQAKECFGYRPLT